MISLDVRQACRRVVATPLLALGAMLTLALGIGSALVMADVLDRLLLRAPAQVHDAERIARVYVRSARAYVDRIDYATFEALQGMDDELEASAVYFSESLTLGRGAGARRVEAVAHSRAYFDVLGVRPLIGSWVDVPGAPREDAAVISHALWQREFGGSRGVLGQPLRIGLDTYSIVAVAPPGFAGIGLNAADVWLPLGVRAEATYGSRWQRDAFFLQAIARLRRGVTRERASERATAAYRATHDRDRDKTNSIVLGDLRPARAPGAPAGTRVEVLVAGMSILVLLITCGNAANMLLVRGLQRDREFVVKTALGASRGRLLREVLAEAGLLAAGAGLVALVVVATGGTLIRRLFLSPLTAMSSPLDARLVLLSVVVCLAAALLLGVAPALRLTARRALNPGHSTTEPPSRILDVFAAAQLAFSLPLVVAAALFVLSLWSARHQDFGMRTDRVAVVTMNVSELGRPIESHALYRQIQARIALLQQVESTALVQNMPMQSMMTSIIEVPGKDLLQGPLSSESLPAFNAVDPSFFTLMGMRLLQGRLFTEAENRSGAQSVAVITESMARGIWPGENPVGKCFYMGGKNGPCTQVVGVVADARLFPSIRPTEQWASVYYVPLEQHAGTSSRTLLVRTSGDPSPLLRTLRREAQTAAADLPYVSVHVFDDIFQSLLRPWRLGSTVFAVFGALSTVIAAIGLAVVAAYGVTRRSREIGIRSALGAEPAQLVRLVLRRSLVVAGGGLAVGSIVAWATGRILVAQLFEIRPNDPRVLMAAPAGLLLVGLVAAWVPARRAARVDPAAALRAE